MTKLGSALTATVLLFAYLTAATMAANSVPAPETSVHPEFMAMPPMQGMVQHAPEHQLRPVGPPPFAHPHMAHSHMRVDEEKIAKRKVEAGSSANMDRPAPGDVSEKSTDKKSLHRRWYPYGGYYGGNGYGGYPYGGSGYGGYPYGGYGYGGYPYGGHGSVLDLELGLGLHL
ncbi:hypothetical protein GGH12_003400 [Coemansia sp. RSA 1822]|nr:hypothetical protein LPJ76_002142 [Coemansia sp. RSA 638]KAJ2542114.1 hypothetical protein GGF49_003122 [Coemansia sp. RSA 1853]KAJ2562216.1 hypothetical protein GGH12_003400 [Coemansia sp. RSA 1822]KAJ2666757.1 hypothetical protein IW148_000747 [Coemansia sp. RSA 1199]